MNGSFRIPQGLTYLDGNSLGPPPEAARELARDLVERQWGDRLIRGWNEGWMELGTRVGDKIGQLLGARPGEVVLADSTSVNLYKLLYAALEARPGRRRVVTERTNFPSDLYVLDGLRRPFPDLEIVMADDPHSALDEQTALLTLSHVRYVDGYRHPMAELDEAAHAVGAWTLWDLSHSAGAVPVDLSTADLAVGCTYKYLNGGPGGSAYLYVRRELQDRLVSPVQGWFGADAAFSFGLDYRPAPGVARFQGGTPPVFSAALVEPGVDGLLAVDRVELERRRVALTERLIGHYDARLAVLGFRLLTPRYPVRRGSHVTFAHPEAWPICQALVAQRVVGDFRTPDALRFGIAPLYNDAADVDRAAEAIEEVVRSEAYRRFGTERAGVT